MGFFLDLGLSPQDAYRAWSITLLQVAGFAELWDAWHGRPPPGLDPGAWSGVPTEAHVAALQHLRRQAVESAHESPDALFESALTMLVAGAGAMR
ncbi:hypothetical protein AB0C69_28205 [Actinomadura sp. NPDC048032]|uniref:hypothetical protein n=1 Tax=Actinomadura sp. NPDC048032 TaxID=3155747 RepID=UPI0033FE203D